MRGSRESAHTHLAQTKVGKLALQIAAQQHVAGGNIPVVHAGVRGVGKSAGDLDGKLAQGAIGRVGRSGLRQMVGQ